MDSTHPTASVDLEGIPLGAVPLYALLTTPTRPPPVPKTDYSILVVNQTILGKTSARVCTSVVRRRLPLDGSTAATMRSAPAARQGGFPHGRVQLPADGLHARPPEYALLEEAEPEVFKGERRGRRHEEAEALAAQPNGAFGRAKGERSSTREPQTSTITTRPRRVLVWIWITRNTITNQKRHPAATKVRPSAARSA